MILWRYTGTSAFLSTSVMHTHDIELSAFCMLRLIAAPNWCFLIADTASFFSFQAASIVEQPVQNSYRLALKARFLWKCFHSYSAMACSKIFPRVSVWHAEWSKWGWVSDCYASHHPFGRDYSTFQEWVEDRIDCSLISPMYDGPHTVGYPF